MLTHNDHMKWKLKNPDGSYSNILFRENDLQRFDWEHGVCSREPDSWLIEWKRSLSHLMDFHGSTFHIFYSGGIDSEITVRTLHEMGARITAHTVVFPDGSNVFETAPARELCAHLGIHQIVHNLDVRKICKSDDNPFFDLSVRYQTNLMTHGLLLYLCEQLDGNPVIACNDLFLWRRQINGDMRWQFPLDESYGCFHKFAKANNYPLIVELGMYTPELMAAFLMSEPVKGMMARNDLVSIYSSKASIYSRLLGTQLLAKRKMIGWENNLAYGLQIARRLSNLNLNLQTTTIEASTLLTNLLKTNESINN